MAAPREISFSSQQENIAAQCVYVCGANESAFYSKLFARLVRVRAHIYDLR
jgi:hypothetical protein